jgi:signal transduction histidine kinase
MQCPQCQHENPAEARFCLRCGARLASQMLASERAPSVIESDSPLPNRGLTVRTSPSPEGVSALIADSTERHTGEVTVLSEILQALNAHVDVAKAFPTVAAGLQRITGCDFSDLFLFDEASDWMTVVALGPGDPLVSPDLRLRIADMPAAPDVLSGRPHMVADLDSERDFPIAQFAHEQGFRSALSVPLHGNEGISGILSLLWRRHGGAMATQVPLVGQIADAIALAVERKRLFEEVDAGRERLKLLSQRLIEVEEVERRHLARELHDEVGQVLTALKLSLDAIDRIPPPAGQAHLRDARQHLDDLLARVRDLSLDLRPAMLDDLGLLAALLWLVDRYSHRTNIQIHIEHRGLDRRLAPTIETGAYRIVQEALTNVARHSGVTQATVRLWVEDGTLTIQIVDKGKGFDPGLAATDSARGGVLGMRERARLLGGDLTVESTPGEGTRVTAQLPV